MTDNSNADGNGVSRRTVIAGTALGLGGFALGGVSPAAAQDRVSGSGQYLPVPAGDRQVEVAATGGGPTVFDGSVPVEAGTNYTIAAIGEIGNGADQPFEPLILQDDPSDPGPDTARVRLVHASPDAPAVDVTLASTGDALFDGLSYGNAADYVEVPAGDYTLQVRGDTPGNDGSVVAEFDVSLDGGNAYTAFAAGYLSPDDEPADTPFDLQLYETEPGDTPPSGSGGVRVAHVSPNAPNVDVSVDGATVIEDLAFGTLRPSTADPGLFGVRIENVSTPGTLETTQYLDVPAGDRQVGIAAATGPTVFDGTVPVGAGTDYTIAAIGELGDEADQPFEPLVLQDDTSDPGAGTARVRLVHASPDAPAVDVTLASTGDALFDGLSYGNAADYVEVPAGDYTLQVRGDTPGNDGSVVAEFDVSLAGGEVYSAFATGYLSPDDEPGDAAFDLDVFTDTPPGDPDDGAGRVRVVHAAPNAPDVDVSVDGATVIRGLAFGSASQQSTGVPLSPGAYAVHGGDNPLFTAGEPASEGIERLAEDGAPGDLASEAENGATVIEAGTFAGSQTAEDPNQPRDGPQGPIFPGGAYEFDVAARPGQSLSFATMFIQSNDLFYAPVDADGIDLFSGDQPVSGDVTDRVALWDASTETDQPPGLGDDQAPRQATPDTGAGDDDSSTVQPVAQTNAEGYDYPDPDDVLQVTVEPIEASAERRLSRGAVGDGGSLTVTLTARFAADQDRVALVDGFSGPVSNRSIDAVTVAGRDVTDSTVFSYTRSESIGVGLVDVEAGELVEVRYTLEIADGVEAGETLQFTGRDGSDVIASSAGANFGTDTVTVGATPVSVADTDDDGEIDTDELRAAIADWASGGFSDTELGEIIRAWARS